MKYLKFIIPVLVLILVVGILAIFFTRKQSSPPESAVPYNPFADVSSNPSETPDAYTTSFYTWYLQVLSTNQSFSSSPDFKSSISQWLTPEFVANWDSIVENTDQNPVLLSQDIQSSWSGNIHTAIASQSQTDATIDVSLGTAPDQQLLAVHLVRNSNGWRIASVDPYTPN